MESDDENELLMNNFQFHFINNLNRSLYEDNNSENLLNEIHMENLSIKDNILNNKIFNETKNIDFILNKSIKAFYLIFNNKKIKDFDDCLKYLEEIEKPNNCVCAAVINEIPGWRCFECSKYDNAIYCNNCYIKSKNLHKGHKVYFLPNSGGMCDCGDPDSLYTFCPEHSGPYSDQKVVDEYISSVFEKEILDKLKYFFDGLFLEFSKYLILSEKCEMFFNDDLFEEKFINEKKEKLDNEKNDIKSLQKGFRFVFQKLLNFLRLISKNNLGMLHLIANYFLKNHFEKDDEKLNEDNMTGHRCIQISQNDIKLFSDKEDHICKCPFFRLIMTNYRKNIELNNDENKNFLLSLNHNLSLRNAYCILFFSQYKEILLNNNEDIINNRNQFFLEDAIELIAKKTNLLEESYDFLYKYVLDKFNQFKNDSMSKNECIQNLYNHFYHMKSDTEYFSTPNLRKIMTQKTSIMKRIIDILCLIHNENGILSIVPHPEFQTRGYTPLFIDFENKLLNIVEEINIFIDWEDIEKIKEIFKYLINKILNQEKEGINKLANNEYSFHLGLYRCFGLFMNSFCFNYSFNNNKCSLIDSINYFKDKIFEPKNQIEKFVDILLKDYFKLFGFIAGIKNNYFNYYENLQGYSKEYFSDEAFHIIDFTLIKYLFVMTDKKIDIKYFLKISNVENDYSTFENIFILNNNKKEKEENKDNKEKIKKKF